MRERIQKVLSRQGVASRREAENLIKQGRVRVNGQVAILGSVITHKDLIELDGKKVEITEAYHPLKILMYHKRVGEISSKKDPQGRPSIFKIYPFHESLKMNCFYLSMNSSNILSFNISTRVH